MLDLFRIGKRKRDFDIKKFADHDGKCGAYETMFVFVFDSFLFDSQALCWRAASEINGSVW